VADVTPWPNRAAPPRPARRPARSPQICALATHDRRDRLRSALRASSVLAVLAVAGLAAAAVSEFWMLPAWLTLVAS
jgi:hypothetical protein